MSLAVNIRRSLIASATLLLVACGGSGGGANPGNSSSSTDVGSASLTGAGATFPEPFYTKAFYAYNQAHSSVTVNYQSVGSGAGIKQYTAGTVDFGASDVPMNADEIAGAGGADSLVQFPTTLGVVSIAYNLPDVQKLQLDGPTITNIFLGKVKKWNDASITALNSGVTLPNKDIAVVHRSDGSGTTYAFTDYLSKQSEEWKSKVGTSKSVQWPAGVGASGNTGVANGVKQAEGGIGYVELAYVVQTKMQQAYVKNKAGKFLQASTEGANAAAAAATGISPTNFSIVDQTGDKSYPITTFSWVIVKKDQKDAGKGKALLNLFKWLVTDGQSQGTDLQYAPLPKPVADLATTNLKTVTSGGTPILK